MAAERRAVLMGFPEGPLVKSVSGWLSEFAWAPLQPGTDEDRFEQSRLVIVYQDVAGRYDALGFVRSWRCRFPDSQILFIAERGSERVAVEAMRAGSTDYLSCPLVHGDFCQALCRLDSTAPGSAPGPCSVDAAAELLGTSECMVRTRERICKVAASSCNVLITGETGTGKELAAEMIHRLSSRRHGPLVSIDCTTLPENLVESELFGFERGAFTGAAATVPGRLQVADGGTVLLDEIGEMSLASQAKLLRVLERRQIYRVGGRRPYPIDVRWIAATNRDLEAEAARGTFRLDLYYRLNVAHIEMPPLRQRPEDIPVLVEHYLRIFSRQYGVHPCSAGDAAMALLAAHDWPGNVRELRNLLESAFVWAAGRELSPEDLGLSLRSGRRRAAPGETEPDAAELLRVLGQTNWNKTKAAERLHWSRMTLYRKLAKYSLREPGTES